MSASDELSEEALSEHIFGFLWCIKEDINALLLDAPLSNLRDTKTGAFGKEDTTSENELSEKEKNFDVCSEFDMVHRNMACIYTKLNGLFQTHRWSTRTAAVDEVRKLSYAQERDCMLDRRNKGGKSLLMRCAGTVLENIPCAFHLKLRRSSKDSMWYLCKGHHLKHTCCVQIKTRNCAPRKDR